jgi:predicted HTH transcriptional regulator
MSTSPLIPIDERRILELGRRVFPQPMAAACGNVLRSTSAESLVDTCIKASEVLARYIAVASLSSFAARTTEPATPPFEAERFAKPLAFGDFIEIVKLITATDCDHPLRMQLISMSPNASKTQEKAAKTAGACLDLILEFRNDVGHGLTGLNAAQAQSLLAKHDLVAVLTAAIENSDCVLRLPLFIIEEQRKSKGKILARVLTLMGESSDPLPEQLELETDVSFDGGPAVAVGDTAVPMEPMLEWQMVKESGNSRLFILDGIHEKKLKYRTTDGRSCELNGARRLVLIEMLAGSHRPAETCKELAGDGFLYRWLPRRKKIEESLAQEEGQIPWTKLDPKTLQWYAALLKADKGKDHKKVIQSSLLDGRTHLEPFEVRQLILLFGKESEVRTVLGRAVIDLRARMNDEERWGERVESFANISTSLRSSIEFFSRHVSPASQVGLTIDGLVATTGTADYIAMREALVNLFIHQDYKDKSAAAQVEIAPHMAMFFNAGCSLVDSDGLVSGGKSQARNPLAARALRLIGFAELAGSGLRALQQVWRKAKRRPPRMESNVTANTFTLTLDWRLLPDTSDSYWKAKLGLDLQPAEATLLNCFADAKQVTVQEAAGALGVSFEEAEASLSRLEKLGLVESVGESFQVKGHLLPLLEQAKKESQPE